MDNTTKKKPSNRWIDCSFDSQSFSSESQNTQELSQSKNARKRPRKHQSKNISTSCISSALSADGMWLHKFAPKEVSDLAVHPRKVSDVKSWILDSMNKSVKQPVPMLLLTGPSGSGKTETVKTIAKNNGITLSEWVDTTSDTCYINWSRESSIQIGANTGELRYFPETQMTVFRRFLLQSSKYSDILGSQSLKKIILIDEFPNAFYKSPSSFHDVLRTYSKKCRCPIVFIVTENRNEETFEHELFPRQLQVELSMSHISFNAIAPTILMKSLNNICSQLKGSDIKTPSKTELEALIQSTSGDIRSAINTLEVLCTSRLPISKTLSKEVSGNKTTKSESENSRDSGLNLFHVLGKILYCKRYEQEAKSSSSKKPPLVEDPELILSYISVSSEYFILNLHQNFMAMTDSIETAGACIERISEADSWASDWNNKDIWETYSISHAVRGLMYHMPTNKTGRKWKPIEKPEWYSANKVIKKRVSAIESSLKGKPYFPRGMDVRGLGIGELVTTHLPFISLSDQILQIAGLSEVLKQVPLFSGSKRRGLVNVESHVFNIHESENSLTCTDVYEDEEVYIDESEDNM